MAFLIVDSGPNPGTRYELSDGGAIKLGRNPDCGIVIQVGAVSRHHAEIVKSNGHYFIKDLESRNGTYLNDRLLSHNEQKQLQSADRVKVCDVVFSFHDDPSSRFDNQAAQMDTESGSGTVLVDDESSSNSTVMSKLDVTSGSSGVQVVASPEVKLAALVEITRSLGKAVALDEVLPQVLNSLFKIFVQADRGFIVLKTENGALVPRWTKTRREQDDTIRISKTIVTEVINRKEAILSADAASDERFEMSQSIADFRIRSMMCAPLVNSDDDAIGVLQIDTLDQRKRFAQEDLEVLASVASQAGIAINNAQLHESALQRKAMERDLQLAHEVQKSFLPNKRPEIEGYEFFDFYRPANHVGGDYFDYIALPDGRTAVIVADVVGHGVAAALLMAKLAAEARFWLASVTSPAEAVTRLNDAIAYLQVDRFVTMVMTVIDPQNHEITIVNSGHMCPIFRRQDGSIEEPGEEEAGLPVGVMEDVEYEQVTIPLGPGESFTMYTDGLNEAMNANDEQYGMDGVRDHVRQGSDIEQMGQALIADVQQFVGDGPQDDDMCLVIVRRV